VENLKDEKFSLKATVDKLSVLILENEEKMNRIKVELSEEKAIRKEKEEENLVKRKELENRVIQG